MVAIRLGDRTRISAGSLRLVFEIDDDGSKEPERGRGGIEKTERQNTSVKGKRAGCRSIVDSLS